MSVFRLGGDSQRTSLIVFSMVGPELNGVSLMTQSLNSVFIALSKGTFFSPCQL